MWNCISMVIYFTSAAVAVDSRHMTASSSAVWSRFSLLSNFVNGHVDNMVHGLSLVTITGRWLSETQFVLVSMTWALTCTETVHQWPSMTREIETWLSDSRVCNNSVVDHTSWRPVLFSLRSCVDRCHVWPYWALRCKPWRWMLRNMRIHRPLWMGFDNWKHIVTYLYDVEKEVQHYWTLAAMTAAWVAGSLKSDTLNYELRCWWDLCSWI